MKKIALSVHREKPSFVFGKIIEPIAMSVEANSIDVKPIYELTFKYCDNESSYNFFTPKKIIKSADKTIVFWDDGTKTIVRRSEDTPDDVYSAFTAAVAERIYGSNSQIKKILRTKVEVIPLSDRIKKKEAEAYKRQLEARKTKEETERPQKILEQFINLDDRTADFCNSGIRAKRRTK